MRIGLTIRTFYPHSGGLQAHAEMLIHELIKQGHDVIIATRSISHTPSFQDFFFFSEDVTKTKINGLDICVLTHPTQCNGLMWLVSKCIARPYTYGFGIKLLNMLFLRQLAFFFEGVDIIHHVGQAHELIGFVAEAVARDLGVPFVLQPTAHPGQWGDSPFDLFLYKKADRLLVHTEYEEHVLKSLGLYNTFDIVGNGISNNQIGNAENFRERYRLDDKFILFLGRKTDDKGYPLIKRAFKIIHKQKTNIQLVCIGPSHSSQETDSNQGHQSIFELGFVSEQEKHDALAACMMLCVPSEGESFGLVYMEAARYAKPSVARRLPVLQELLGNDGATLVGQSQGPGNKVQLSAEELAVAIITLLDNPEKTEQMGQKAYAISEKFLWPQVMKNFESAYLRAISDVYIA